MTMQGMELQVPKEKNKEATEQLATYFENVMKTGDLFDVEVLQPLFEKGADANIVVKNWTLLQYAAQCDEAHMPVGIIDFLVKNGADVNQRTLAPTSTGLSTAIALAEQDKAEKLIQHGLNLELLSSEELGTYQRIINVKTLRAYQEFRRGARGLEPLHDDAGKLQWRTNNSGAKIYDGKVNPEKWMLPLELICLIGEHLGISEKAYFPREKEKNEQEERLEN